jgi:GNAT superfamily N-acetyltransferase
MPTFAPMQIVEVTAGKSLRDWQRVPWRIYAEDRNWVPHLVQDVEKVFDPAKNKLLRSRQDRKAGAIKRWVLYGKDGHAAGRIAAFVDPKTAWSDKQQPTGGCGFFECINDQQAANLLFGAARDWLGSQGMEAMDGPVNLGERNMFWGLLIENFTDPPIYGTNYNPPYYVELFKEYGFQVYFKQLFFRRNALEQVQPIFQRKYNQFKNDPDFLVRNATGMPLEQLAEDFRSVLNAAWVDHENFKPMPKEVALKTIKQMKPVMDPRIIVFVYHKGAPIAFYINLPELNQIFRHVNGNLNWLGKLKFLWHKWRGTATTMTGIVFGVVKEWQGKGVEGAMIAFMGEWLIKTGRYKETVLTWIGDFNPKMLRVCENLGASNYRTLATWRYLFDRTKPFERLPIIGKKGT